MHPDKSPGPNGMSPGFFQRFWDVVGGDVVNYYKQFFETGRLAANANNTYVVLIPKKVNPDNMKDLRPITLCNVLYKIVAKVCANIMKCLLEGLISPTQRAFVLGRTITDNIMLA